MGKSRLPTKGNFYAFAAMLYATEDKKDPEVEVKIIESKIIQIKTELIRNNSISRILPNK